MFEKQIDQRHREGEKDQRLVHIGERRVTHAHLVACVPAEQRGEQVQHHAADAKDAAGQPEFLGFEQQTA